MTEQNEQKHTPLKISRLSDDVRTLISNKDNHLVLQTIGDKHYELVELVVRAVNSHEANQAKIDKLVEGCKLTQKLIKKLMTFERFSIDADLQMTQRAIKQALVDAEGGTQ